MKVIFLDIDGVLSDTNDLARDVPISHIKVARLNFLVDITDARLVLSSSLRITIGLDKTEQLLQEHGLIYPFIGAIPFSENKSKGENIQCWLNNNPEVTKFVILDDCDDMGDLINHLVQTKWFCDGNEEQGLLYKHVEQAIRMLNTER